MGEPRRIGLMSGVGLVIANMVGAGVFLSTGFMAQSLSPSLILLNWLVGGALALAGARAYAEVARLVPRGGGEYRYLTELMHAVPGYIAGWGSLVLGFAAPIAIDALAAGAFARAVIPAIEPRYFAAALVLALTALHAVGFHVGTRVQNGLVGLKLALLMGFVVIGVAKGSWAWPQWQPPQTPTLGAFTSSLFFVAFAYSGWNAAVYAADEFKNPARDVSRAMLIGCAGVTALYLVVNAIFVMNLTPAQGSVVFNYDAFTSSSGQWDQVTLGQAVMAHLLGPAAARVMSGVMVLLFISAMSAMTFIGPRVVSAMANDGFLPRPFAVEPGKTPVAGLLLQGAIAIALLFTHELRSALANVGAVLVLFAAMTAAALFTAYARAKTPEQKPGVVSLVCAGVYVASSAWMLYFGFSTSFTALLCRAGLGLSACETLPKDASPSMVLWVAAVVALALVAYAATRALKRSAA